MSDASTYDNIWAEKTDQQLFDALAQKNQYAPEAIEAVQRQIARRNLDSRRITDLEIIAAETVARQAAKESFWNYVAFSAAGFIILGPLSYRAADRTEWPWVLFPIVVFIGAWNFHRSMRGAVMTGVLWAGLSFLILVSQFGTPYHFVKDEIRQLTDSARLAQIAEDHPKKLVRMEAVLNKKLQDQLLFLRIVTKDLSYEVREAAAGRIIDIDTLKRVRDIDEAWQVRSAAESRLKELVK